MKYIVAIATTLIIFAPIVLFAQGPGGSSSLGDPGVPIDGGASLLAGAAIMYGVKKLRDGKQDKRWQQ